MCLSRLVTSPAMLSWKCRGTQELGIVKPKALLPVCCLPRLICSQYRPEELRNRPLPSLCFPPLCFPSLSSPPLLYTPFSRLLSPTLSSPLMSVLSSPYLLYFFGFTMLCSPRVLSFSISQPLYCWNCTGKSRNMERRLTAWAIWSPVTH